MPRDPAKARARRRRYLERKKIEKYGPAAAGVNMSGRHGNHARGPANGRYNPGRPTEGERSALDRVSKEKP